MKASGTFTKIFVTVSLFTLICWSLSYGLAALAGEKPYPKSLLAKVEKKINADLVEVHKSESRSTEGVGKVEIIVNSVDVEVIGQSGNEIKANLDGFSSVDIPLVFEAHEDGLIIKVEGKSQARWDISLGSQMSYTKSMKLKLLIPQNFHSELIIRSSSGDIKLASSTLDHVMIKTGSGDASIEKITANALGIDSGSGDVDLSGHIKAVTVKTGSGDILLSGISADSVDLRTGSGDVMINLGDFKLWTAQVTTGSGDILSSFPEQSKSGSSRKLRAGMGPRQLTVFTGSGDVALKL